MGRTDREFTYTGIQGKKRGLDGSYMELTGVSWLRECLHQGWRLDFTTPLML